MKKFALAATLAMGLMPSPASAVTYVIHHNHCACSRAHRRVVYRRTKKRSAAIIASSAATGASIGALAGGGIGAGIGAIAGGASGFIYDRATHKKVICQ